MNVLQRLADLMEEHQEELATIESLDSGAVYTLALKTHIGMSIATLRYFAGWADKIQVWLNMIINIKRSILKLINSSRRYLVLANQNTVHLWSHWLEMLKCYITAG